MNNKYQYPAVKETRDHQYHPTRTRFETKRKKIKIFNALLFWCILTLIGSTLISVITKSDKNKVQNTVQNTLQYDINYLTPTSQQNSPTPTTSQTLQPTIDYDATQQANDDENRRLDLEKTQIAKQTQDYQNNQLFLANLELIQKTLEVSNIELDLKKKTLEYADPIATQQAQHTNTQFTLNLIGTATQESFENIKKVNEENQTNGLKTWFRFFFQITASILIVLLFCLLIYICYQEIDKRKQKIKNTVIAHQMEEITEAEDRAYFAAESAEQLKQFVEEAIEINGENSNRFPGHEKMGTFKYPEWSKHINLLKIESKVYLKEGGRGAKGYMLKRGRLIDLLEKIENGSFPPPGSFGRSETSL